VHDPDEARRAAEAAMMIFGNVNLDLMFALPGQTLDEAGADVSAALGFGTPHLSFYQLTLEPNTLFHRYPPALPDDDLAADMQAMIEARLAAAGYPRYEVSAYAKAGRECAHNLNYWRFGDYLGIGAGAHTKLSFPDRIERQVRFRQPAQYLEKATAREPILERSLVTRDDLGFEFMLNALRLTQGVPTPLFAERAGMPFAHIARDVDEAVKRGLLDPDPAVLRPTPLGRRFLNDLTALFLHLPGEAR
jgi:oxygen-independent coproporphyrinogen-3 oxidase